MKYLVICAFYLFFKFLIISASVLPRVLNDKEYIRCDYVHRIGIARYECLLSINNPNSVEFDNIEGTHIDGMSDEDVEVVYAYSGNTKIVPSIVCRQFPNVHQLALIGLNIEEITPSDLSECHNLGEIYLNSNKITVVPANTFANSPGLAHIELSNNNLSVLVANLFSGTAAELIVLDNNKITSINSNWFSSINETLKHLSLGNNLISVINSDDLRDLHNLEILSLGSNSITHIASAAFSPLSKLKSLDLNGCSLTSVDADWFQSLSSLTVLNIQNNMIEDFPDGIFKPLTNLRSFFFRGNNLMRLSANAFGDSLQSITALFGERNRIRAIDPNILQEASKLEVLYLGGNVCIQENFANVQNNLDKILSKLSICIALWDAVPELECSYDVTIYGEYRCNLQVFNPLGDELESIIGNHIPEKSDNDVQLVSIVQQNTKTFPTVICSQFGDIREIFVMNSHLEVLEAANFENCRNMEQIYINQNRIASIPASLFANSPKLFYISLSTNYISYIHPSAFIGTIAESLDLGNNQLTAINPEWFVPISEKLDMVDFFGNLLTTLPDETFSALKHVEFLMLGNNRLQMSNNPFVGLDNIKILALGRNNLQRLNPSWFEPIPHLQELFLCMNGIAELQSGIFSSFKNLSLLRLNGNRLKTVSAEMIGPSISTLRNIQVINNQMVSFDPQIFEGAKNLKYLKLEGNICINEAFDDVQSELDRVSNELRTCFRNFDTEPEITCEYEVTADNEYICNVQVHNPFNKNFQFIPGEHLTYRTNNEVTKVSINAQNTRTFPLIICKQFENIREILVIDSNLDTIEPSVFEACRHLERVSINLNRITALPANLFINSPKLSHFSFASNRINQIHPDAFSGTELKVLDLSSNILADINKNLFIPISQSLEVLNVMNNSISHIPDGTFSDLINLKELMLSINQVRMENYPFEGLTSLEQLGLGRNGITELNQSWFTSIPQLQTLFLCGNQVSELQDGVFSSFENISTLRLNENSLIAVKAESLGNAAITLRNLQFKNNQITSFDPQIIENAINLQLLMLEGNVCIDQNFEDVQASISEIKELLSTCSRRKLTAFSGIECIYDVTATGYRCNALINNPTGIDFSSIGGQHLPGRTDANVQIVNILSQNTRNFPGIFCRQFTNVQEVSIVQSNLVIVESPAFADCRAMERIIFNENSLTSLPANLFVNSPRLHHVSFLFNQISQIHANAFSGTSIEFLDFGNNLLTAINSQWFIPISSTLRSLDFFNNMISQVTDGQFSSLSNVEFLMIGMNGVQLGNNPFLGLTSLRTLGLGRNGIRQINPSWFTPIPQLQELFLCGNSVSEIRTGDLDGLRNLITLRLIGNNLSNLRLESLGPSISTLRNIQFIQNVITSIDPQIIERTPNLQILMLEGNICVNQDFLDVANQRDFVRQQLQQCHSNF